MQFFETFIYQPFFNILVGLYWLIGQFMPEPDMGIAVILFSVAVRLILLPIDLAGSRSDKEKFDIALRVHKLKKDYDDDPIKQAEESKKIMRQSPGAIVSEIVNIIIQFVIIIMLYRIFKTGLEGADFHLLYDFMPHIPQPINLMFLGKYDLSQTNNTLNLIQSLMIAINEIFHLYFSPVKPTRKDFISLVIIFPVFCFLVFIFLPAGKKVFIITSLAFSITKKLIEQTLFLYYSLTHRAAGATLEATPSVPASPSEAPPQPPPPPAPGV